MYGHFYSPGNLLGSPGDEYQYSISNCLGAGEVRTAYGGSTDFSGLAIYKDQSMSGINYFNLDCIIYSYTHCHIVSSVD